ncbi:YhhN-like protein [Streptomyces sp. YIM 130001]|uniref:lysoplasmalogenase n=1 Tax=Streptomyces sp. YIM 130001 TaxID=2259644 RepID=UPI000E650395|nr:lysoplasmalogenase [Streptomyces sp. YIM 130001]RII18572.1 YhhN-like protein [Streptomyces sp. YIM 130001]
MSPVHAPGAGERATRPPAAERAAQVLLVAFATAVVGDLGSLLAGWEPGHLVCKPLLLLLLAAHVAARGGPRLLVVALLFGWGGDVLLLVDADAAFLAGMGSFAAGHVCYLLLFARYGSTRARGAWLAAAYAVALVATVAALWGGLPTELRIPVAGYSLLLTAMACRASRIGWAAGIGGALFLLSDTLIATGLADWPQLPRPDFWVMLTYTAAQALLAHGVLRAVSPRGDGPTTPEPERR